MSIAIEVKIDGYSAYGMTSQSATEAVASVASIVANGDVSRIIIETATATEMTVADSTE